MLNCLGGNENITSFVSQKKKQCKVSSATGRSQYQLWINDCCVGQESRMCLSPGEQDRGDESLTVAPAEGATHVTQLGK